MKRHFIIFHFSISLLSGLIQPVSELIRFFIQQEDIVTFWCKEREAKENTCMGYCYLKAQLSHAEGQEQHVYSFLQLDTISQWIVFFPSMDMLVAPMTQLYHPDVFVQLGKGTHQAIWRPPIG